MEKLSETLLGLKIQSEEYGSASVAHRTMAIYLMVEQEWESDERGKQEKKKSTKKISTLSDIFECFTDMF